MTELILFFSIIAAAIYFILNSKDKKEDNENGTNYDQIDLIDIVDDPDLPDITYSDDNNKILQPDQVFDLPDREVFARTLYGEGRSLSTKEIEKIGWVIRNRVKDNGRENYPDNYKDVCLQKYQFSCWNSLYNQSMSTNQKEVRRNVLSDQVKYEICYEIAGEVMFSPEVNNPLPNVQHYVLNTNNVKISGDRIENSPYPSWVNNMKIVENDGKGSHIFLA